MSEKCSQCGAVLADSNATHCAQCGQTRPSSSDVAAGTVLPDNAIKATTSRGFGERVKTGCGVLFLVLLCGLGLFVVIAGLWVLFMPQDPSAELPVVSDFVTKASFSMKDPVTGEPGKCRFLEIQYWGVDNLERVKIDCSFQFVDRTSAKQSESFGSWKPGEHKYIVFKPGPPYHYQWKGEAQIDGRKVKLGGGIGDYQ